jgi:hypothetical protein
MSRQYHFVIMFDDETKEWDFDIDGEEIAFSSGTIYNDETKSWEYGYAGNGNFVGMEDELATQLTKQLDKWNLSLKTGEKK